MKNKIKISTLSIVCVLCASVAMPGFAASSVRALGGAGTYSSASSAAAAKADGTAGGGAINSVRAGSMRVNNVAGANTGATRSGSARAATTPRLSIGKYLSGSSAITGGSSISGANKPGAGGGSGNDLRERVAALEEFVDFSAGGDTLAEQLASVKLDVKSLKEDVKAAAGFVTDVEFDYASGDLIVSVLGAEPVKYELKDYFDGQIGEALQSVLDDVQSLDGKLAGFYTKSEVDAALSEMRDALQSAIDDKQQKGDYAAADEFETLKATVESLQSGGADKAVLDGLQSSIDSIKADYAKKSELNTVEARLQAAIDAISVPSLDGYLTKDVADQTYATKSDVQTEVDAMLEPQGELATYVTNSIVKALNEYEIPDNSVTVEKIAGGAVTADKINSGMGNPGELMMLMSKGDGTSEWVSVTVDAEY